MKNNSNYLRNINCIDVSYAGGKDGMEITDKIIKSSIVKFKISTKYI